MQQILEINIIKEPFYWFRPISAGPVPTACDTEGIYPYQSFTHTESRPSIRMITLLEIKNKHLKIKICPSLGGRVHSIESNGKEFLYKNNAVKPVRILPRGAFVSGGIEVSFPVSHSPVQLEPLQYKYEIINNRAYIWLGEREKRFGLNYTIEFSLGENDKHLTQRLKIKNKNKQPYPWMSWSNAAVISRTDSIYDFPEGEVLMHSSVLKKINWASEGPETVSDQKEMAGYFWHKPEADAFGIYTPSTGCGLYHYAEKDSAPGMKLWTYGTGKDEKWGEISSINGENYIEIQGGPLSDQSIKTELQPGEEKISCEYWIPTETRLNLKDIKIPQQELIDQSKIPDFTYTSSYWNYFNKTPAKQLIAEGFNFPEPETENWLPSSFEDAGHKITEMVQILSESNEINSEEKQTKIALAEFHAGCWHAARNNFKEAEKLLNKSEIIPGLILMLRIKRLNGELNKTDLSTIKIIQQSYYSNHPSVIIELDKNLEELNMHEKRLEFLMGKNCTDDEFTAERLIDTLISTERFKDAEKILEQTTFQLVHQRYDRKELLTRLKAEGLGTSIDEEALGEDSLAPFGAYREYEE